jgi:prepilin-type processing-associated H-X9-DG protein
MWFCPTRAQQYSDGVAWCKQNLIPLGTHSMATLDDLVAYVSDAGYGFSVCFHAWWVPRFGNPGNSFVDPGPPRGSFPYNPPPAEIWPSKTTDASAARLPILTDRSANLNDPNPLHAGEAHPYGGRLSNTDLLFADGHVETRKASLIQMRYRGNYYNFY